MTDQEYIEAARDEYQIDGEIEIDDDAIISRVEESDIAKGAPKGAYVQAWVWIYEETEESAQ